MRLTRVMSLEREHRTFGFSLYAYYGFCVTIRSRLTHVRAHVRCGSPHTLKPCLNVYDEP
jgi:hypothetical protein